MSELVQGRRAGTLLAPALLLGGLLLLIAGQLGYLQAPASAPVPQVAPPQTVTIAPRAFAYRATGEFLRDGYPEEAPLVGLAHPPALEIMTFEVGAADYARCVAAGACRAAEPRRPGAGDVPVTGVSFEDATSYARWLSEATGTTWRLPTVAEWVFAAGSQAVDPVLAAATDTANPAERWLALYEKEALLGSRSATPLEPRGAFGTNEFGVADLEGPVWEWTASCNSRTQLDAAGRELSRLDSCGVRLLEGRHRTAMSYFIRDGRTGGCSVGAPPDNLGFRLVREPGLLEQLLRLVTP